MGYSGDRLANLGVLGPTRHVARRIAERAGDALHDEVVRRTPVKHEEPVWAIEGVDFVRARRGRVPGTLKRSWRVGTIEDRDGRYRIEIYTDDPVAPYVEYPTRPHKIRARRVSNLRFPDESGLHFRYTPEVNHPGTQGSYMMRDALAYLSVEWQVIARDELRGFGRMQMEAAKAAG